jgi:hypothetical protein
MNENVLFQRGQGSGNFGLEAENAPESKLIPCEE